MKRKLAREIRIFLENHGIDPIYFATIVSLVVFMIYFDNIKNWDKIGFPDRALTFSVCLAAAFLTSISILRLFGLIKL